MTFGEYLKKRMSEWKSGQLDKTGDELKDKHFAKWLGVEPTTFSSWKRDEFTPRYIEDVKMLASKLGEEVYDILGWPRPMPEELKPIWPHLTDEDRRRLTETAKKMAEKNKGEQQDPKSNRATAALA